MLHKEIPFLRICLPLCAGIISGLYIRPDTPFLIFSVLVVTAGFILSLHYNRYESNKVFGYSITLSFFLCGLMLYTREKNSLTILEPRPSLFICTLSDYPAEKTGSYMLTVKLNSMMTEDANKRVKGSLLLYHRKDSLITTLLPGDLIVIQCTPSVITKRGNPFEFDYKFFLENQGIRHYAFTNSRSIISHSAPPHRKLVHRALIIREKIIDMYRERGITGERLALVAAITLGQKNMLDQEQKSYFIKAGVMHIMAVSGLHTVILSLFVFNVLFFLKGRFNILRVLLTLFILWAFAFVTGLTPSVLRATLMFTFLQAGQLMKRDINGINSVLASAFILILIRPSVIFDAGFLLSYSAVIYIIAFYRDFYQKLRFRNYLADKIWQSAVVTIVAQAGTLPLTITLFNRFPVYFILTNIIIVPLSSLLVITGCLVPLMFPVKFLSHPLAVLLGNLTALTEFLTKEAAGLPYSTLENIGMPTIECIFLSITIFLLSFFMLKKKTFSHIYILTSILAFLLAGTFREIFTKRTNELIVYSTPGKSTIGIRTGKILTIFSDTLAAGSEITRHSSMLGLRVDMKPIGSDPQYVTAGNTKILITNYMNEDLIKSFSPGFVILTGSRPIVDRKYFSEQKPGYQLVAAQGVPASASALSDRMVVCPIYIVKRSGAFIRRI